MGGVRGCFVCGQDYRAADMNPPKDVAEDVKELKERAPNAYLTVEDLDALLKICGKEEEEPGKKYIEDEAQWVKEKEEDGVLHISLAEMNVVKNTCTEPYLANAAILLGSSDIKDHGNSMDVMNVELLGDNHKPFTGSV